MVTAFETTRMVGHTRRRLRVRRFQIHSIVVIDLGPGVANGINNLGDVVGKNISEKENTGLEAILWQLGQPPKFLGFLTEDTTVPRESVAWGSTIPDRLLAAQLIGGTRTSLVSILIRQAVTAGGKFRFARFCLAERRHDRPERFVLVPNDRSQLPRILLTRCSVSDGRLTTRAQSSGNPTATRAPTKTIFIGSLLVVRRMPPLSWERRLIWELHRLQTEKAKPRRSMITGQLWAMALETAWPHSIV